MKTRKLLAIVLAVAMLASFVSIPVFAEGEGEALETLGVLMGTGDGVTEEYLASTATRAQAALIHLRLFGLEDEALAFDGEETFTDAADATEFWQPVLEYLKANPELGWQGYPDGSFMPNGTITGQGFTKVLLVALGYEEGVDFEWETVMTFAATVGLDALADKADEDLLVEDLAMALVEALGTKTTADIDVTLLTWLVMEGVVSAEDAEAAGFEVEEPALKIVSAGPTAIDEITVEMSTDVPEDTDVTLKRGSIGLVYDLEIDGSTVVLSGLYKFLPGTYTVTIGDETATFVIESQTATGLVVGADTIYDDGTQDLKVKLADQYGDAMSLTGANVSVFNQSTGYVFTPDVSTTVKITIEDISTTSTPVMNAKAGDVVYVFVYDPASGLTATKEVLVMEAPYIAWLEIGDVTIAKDGDTTPPRIYTNTDDHKLDVTAYDQYNQEYTLTNTDIQTGTTYTNKVQILSSNSGVISAGGITVDKGDLVFDADATGSAVITLIIPDQGFITTSEMITVYAEATLTSVQVAGPVEAVYADETAKFPIVGVDQYGDPIDVETGDDVDFTTTVNLGDVPAVTAKNEVSFAPTDDGTTTVYYFCNGIFQDTFTVTVNPEAYPFQITGIDVPGALQTGVTQIITGDAITVLDQYGREMDAPFGTYDGAAYDYVAKAKTDEEHVILLSGSGYTLSTAGLTAGTDQFTLVLTKDTVEQPDSTFVFEVTNIKATDIDGFALGEMTKMYTGTDIASFGQAAGAYNKTVEITGTADGVTVKLLDADTDGLPDIIDLVTSSNDAVEVVSGSIITKTMGEDAVDGTSAIKAWRNGEVVASTDLALAKAAPDLASITVVKAGTYSSYATSFKYADQYGVALGGAVVTAADSPYGADGDYTIEASYVVGDYTWYTVVKWDGSLSAIIKVKN